MNKNSEQVILEASRTVSVAYQQFGELKAVVTEMLKSRSGRERGHFTPKEDEAIRQTLVTYWQLRIALLETIYQLYKDVGRSRVSNPHLFLPGYAGALILVDSARFMREKFHHEPLIRKKLNEPEPNFGIPADVYNTVQGSLVKVRTAWKLYHAARYFALNRDTLKSFGQDDDRAAEMFGIVESLSERLNVRFSDYAKARIRFQFRQWWMMFERDLCFSAMYRMQKLAGDLMAGIYVKPNHKPQMPDKIQNELKALLSPGDVLLTRKEYAVSNYLLPGYWPHAALYLGDTETLQESGLESLPHVQKRWEKLMECDADDTSRVLESMKDGVHIRTLQSPYQCDSLLVLRPQISANEITEAIGRGLHHEGKDFDFNFDFSRADRLVCTAVVFRSYDGVGTMELPLKMRTGRLTLAAEDLARMGLASQNFDIVAAYIPDVDQKVLVGADAVEKVKPIFA